MSNLNYDVIVVGAGHAGVEAALASSRQGLKTAMFTIFLDNIAMMSCNPSIGGPGKSHLVAELDVLGGEMGKHVDLYNLQLKSNFDFISLLKNLCIGKPCTIISLGFKTFKISITNFSSAFLFKNFLSLFPTLFSLPISTKL